MDNINYISTDYFFDSAASANIYNVQKTLSRLYYIEELYASYLINNKSINDNDYHFVKQQLSKNNTHIVFCLNILNNLKNDKI